LVQCPEMVNRLKIMNDDMCDPPRPHRLFYSLKPQPDSRCLKTDIYLRIWKCNLIIIIVTQAHKTESLSLHHRAKPSPRLISSEPKELLLPKSRPAACMSILTKKKTWSQLGACKRRRPNELWCVISSREPLCLVSSKNDSRLEADSEGTTSSGFPLALGSLAFSSLITLMCYLFPIS
jgi:hypothetical protein